MVNEQDKDGNTALHHLVSHCNSIAKATKNTETDLNCLPYINVLLDHDADLDTRSKAENDAEGKYTGASPRELEQKKQITGTDPELKYKIIFVEGLLLHTTIAKFEKIQSNNS